MDFGKQTRKIKNGLEREREREKTKDEREREKSEVKRMGISNCLIGKGVCHV